MKPERIPIFPLELVLFPGTPLPLHIFEPRYKLMISRCVEQHLVFGVVLLQGDKLAGVGCTAEVIKIIHRRPDGRMDILTQGRDTIRITQTMDDEPYSEALVEYLEDLPAKDEISPTALLAAFQKCHTVIYRQGLAPENMEGEAPLSYRLAAELPLELAIKQELLEMRSETERRARLLTHLKEWALQLERTERVRAKAAGNGHSHD